MPLTEQAYLVKVIERVLHALDGHVLAILDRLATKHLREGALALFS